MNGERGLRPGRFVPMRLTVLDAHGRHVTLTNVKTRGRSLQNLPWQGYVWFGACFLPPVLVVMAAGVLRIESLPRPLVIATLVLSLLCAFVLPAVMLCVWSWRYLSVSEARLRLSRCECAGCTYSLAGARADNDGIVVCPECGAAWPGKIIGQV